MAPRALLPFIALVVAFLALTALSVFYTQRNVLLVEAALDAALQRPIVAPTPSVKKLTRPAPCSLTVPAAKPDTAVGKTGNDGSAAGAPSNCSLPAAAHYGSRSSRASEKTASPRSVSSNRKSTIP